MNEQGQLEQAIAMLEAQRAVLGDEVVDIALAPLRAKLATLRTPPAANPEQRKQATILFADLAGFTAMSERLDPEEVRAITQRYFQAVTYPIRQHGGWIEKYIGDAIMAVFGIPTAREQDVEHATRAALEMQQALNALNDEMEPRWGFRLHMRVGINTGLVLVGYLGEDFTVVGDAVNLASRLEHAAPTGGVLLSHDAYRHVRGLFDTLALGAISVKGRADPVPIYLVERVKPRALQLATRGVEGIETQTVGREAELRQMQEAWRRVLGEQRMQVLLITAEAGLGKSRLLYEFHHWMELRPNLEDWGHFPIQRFWLLWGRAHQESGRPAPYALLRDLLSFRFRIQESDTPAIARKKLEQGLLHLMGDAVQVEEVILRSHFLGYLMGFGFTDSPHLQGVLHDTRQIRDRAYHYASQLLDLAAHQRPIVLYLEDIHWADDETLDLLSYLFQTCARIPILVICLARPSLFRRQPPWGGGQLAHHLLSLDPLTPAGTARLVREILREMEEVPPELTDLIISRADGNPFYVEEIIKMLIEDEVILKEPDRWWVNTSRLRVTRIPPTLMGVLQARLDSLPPADRTLLQRASVIGRVFWDDALLDLGSAEDATRIDYSLALLCQREFIFRRQETAFEGTREYIFKHALLHEVTYETVLRQQRPLYHAQVARWLLKKGGSRTVEYAGHIAAHFERAEKREEAAKWYKRAGYQAQAAYANQVAADYFDRALALLPESGRGRVQFALGGVLELLGRWDEAEVRYRDTLAMAQQQRDEVAAANCQEALGRIAKRQGEYHTAMTWLEKARIDWACLGDQAGVSRALREIGHAFWDLGEYERASRYLSESLALARGIRDKPGMATALRWLGTLATSQGYPSTAKPFLEESLALFRELSDKAGVVWSLNDLGSSLRNHGNYAAARPLHEEQLALAQEIGDKSGVAYALANLGFIACFQGLYTEARAHLEKALGLAREMRAKRAIAERLLGLGHVALDQGDYTLAYKQYEEAHSLFDQTGFKGGLAFWPRGFGYLKALRGDYAEAHEHLEADLALARAMENKIGQASSLDALGVLALLEEDEIRARTLLEESVTLIREVDTRLGISFLSNLGYLALLQGDHERARLCYAEVLTLAWEVGARRWIAIGLLGLAGVAVSEPSSAETAEWRARLVAAAETLLASIGAVLDPIEARPHACAVSGTRAALDAARARPHPEPLEQVVAAALHLPREA